MNLFNSLEISAKQYTNKTALHLAGKKYSYDEMKLGMYKAVALLKHYHVSVGSRVALLINNSAELIFFYYACFRLGAIAIPINTRYQFDEITHILNDALPDVFIFQSAFIDLVENIRNQCTVENYVNMEAQIHTVFSDNLLSKLQDEISEQLPAVIFYTSGSTAKAKGVVHTQRSLILNAFNHSRILKYTSDDVSLICLPLSISFSFCHQVLTTLITGGSLYVLERFDPKVTLHLLLTASITKMYGSPVIYSKIIAEIKKNKITILHHLNTAIVAGDSVSKDLHHEFHSLFSMNLCAGIGMTETLFYALDPMVNNNKIGSLGLPTTGVSIRILDENGVEQPHGAVGEISILTETHMQQYWNNPKETKNALFDNGWLRSGDLGYLDEDGYLWFQGRKKHIIVRGGMNISPVEIESTLQTYNPILETAVIGLPDQLWGEIAIAFIVMKVENAELEEEKIRNFLRKHIADYKIPEKIIFVDQLPKTISYKIDRLALRRQALTLLNCETHD